MKKGIKISISIIIMFFSAFIFAFEFLEAPIVYSEQTSINSNVYDLDAFLKFEESVLAMTEENNNESDSNAVMSLSSESI